MGGIFFPHQVMAGINYGDVYQVCCGCKYAAAFVQDNTVVAAKQKADRYPVVLCKAVQLCSRGPEFPEGCPALVQLHTGFCIIDILVDEPHDAFIHQARFMCKLCE